MALLILTGAGGTSVENAYGVESIKIGGIIGERIDKAVYGCLMKID